MKQAEADRDKAPAPVVVAAPPPPGTFLDDKWRNSAGWADYGKGCMTAAMAKLEEKFGTAGELGSGELGSSIRAYKVARNFRPLFLKGRSLSEVEAELDDLAIFPFIKEDDVVALKVQLPVMLAKLQSITATDMTDDAILQFWFQQRNDPAIKMWHDTFIKIAVVTPTSAAIERVFSVLRRMFNDQQESALADYLQIAVMLVYNKRGIE